MGSSLPPLSLPVALGAGILVPALDISSMLAANQASAAAENAAILQAAIISGQGQSNYPNTISITKPGVYYLSQVVMYSYTNLYIGPGVTLRKPPSTTASMFINWGALQATPSVDTDIGFYGYGVLDGNSQNQSVLTTASSGGEAVNTFLYGVQGEIAMIGVNNFTCKIRYPYNCNGFVVQWIGQNAHFADMIPNTNRDFIHINGPSSHIEIKNCAGYSNDAFIALNAWDWHRSGPTVGDIDDVRIENVAYYGASGLNGNTRTACLVALLPGTRVTGNGQGTGNVRNVSVDGFKFAMNLNAGGAPASAAIDIYADFDAVNGTEFAGAGLIENVSISNGYATVPNSNCNLLVIDKTATSTPAMADGQNTLTVRNLLVEKVHADASVSVGGNPVNITMGYNYCYLEKVIFRDVQWTPMNGVANNQNFINYANKTMADSIEIDGLTINSSTATGGTAAILVNQYASGLAATINDLTVNRVATAPGYQIPQAWMLINGVVNNLRSKGNYLIGSGAGTDGQGIFLNAATAQIVYGTISDSYFNGVKEGLQINGAVSSGVAATVVYENCQIVNQTHPVFINGAYSADVTYRGGSVNSAANLARVATGSLILGYSDTQATGAGNEVVTLVTGGTVELRKTDRIAISATQVLMPQNNDIVNFAGTPAYTGVNVISGTGAGLYVYRGTGTVGWVKLN
jgi:hypothetical protein